MNYQIELLHSLLNEFLQGESALLTVEGDVLAVRGQEPATFGTLAAAAKTAYQYLQLQEGDIAILNDPYSGGSLLSDITFIMTVSEDLLWVSRRSLGKSLTLGKTIEEEGLRIPPTPVLQQNQINEAILAAMAAHPACPANMIDWLKVQCGDMAQQGRKLLDVLEFTGFTITSDLIADYLELSRKTAQLRLSERVSGEAQVDVILDSGELLRLKLEILEGRIAMDFGGTSAAKAVSLTEAATFGACFYAISRFYDLQQIANTGTFSILQITKPTGCWLMAKYPAPTIKGMICGVAAIERAIDLALSQIHHKNGMALASHCPLHFSFQLADQSVVLTLPGGRGASAEGDGDRAQMKAFSIEELERRFPVKVLTVDQRQSQGGKGKYNGGRGLLFRLQAQGEFAATWITDLNTHLPRLAKNSSHGDPGEISIERNGNYEVLPPFGHRNFISGEIITLCSGSGGGYGKD